jgi:hypothetical protein
MANIQTRVEQFKQRLQTYKNANPAIPQNVLQFIEYALSKNVYTQGELLENLMIAIAFNIPIGQILTNYYNHLVPPVFPLFQSPLPQPEPDNSHKGRGIPRKIGGAGLFDLISPIANMFSGNSFNTPLDSIIPREVSTGIASDIADESLGGSRKKGSLKTPSKNPWIAHVKAVASKKGISYSEALEIASKTYKK